MLLLGSVTYSGALTIQTLAIKAGYKITLAEGSFVIGMIAMLYVTAGGLKACAWADLIQGSALIIGGAVIMFFAFDKLGQVSEAAMVVSAKTGAVEIKSLSPDDGALTRFWSLNEGRMNMFLPASDSVLPWTALLLGLWIPNFYYWGLNQYITQRTLGSASLAQGQRGIVFAAALKLVIPFVIVIPGIIAFNLFSDEMRKEAVGDTSKSLTLYLKANPETQFVERRGPLGNAEVVAWQPGRYVIALYPNDDSLNTLTNRNPYVLPLTQERFDELTPEPFTVFTTEDQAWKHVHPGLSQEIQVFNEAVAVQAEAAGEKTEK
jgi:SSS family solute:Na+ symporter